MAEATSKLTILATLKDNVSSAMRSISNSLSDLGGAINFTGDKSGLLAGGLAALGGTTIQKGISAFADAETAMAKFDAIIKSLPPGLQKYREELLAAADGAMNLGFDDDEAAISAAKLLSATRDKKFALQALGVAMDLSRYGGISLEAATQKLILSFQGGGKLLKEFGINVDDHASKETILAAVMEKVNGQSESYIETLNGMGAAATVAGTNISEGLGQPFGKSIEQTLKIIGLSDDLNKKIKELEPLWNSLGLAIGAVTLILASKAIPAIAETVIGFLGLNSAITIGSAGIMASLGVWLLVVAAITLVAYATYQLITNWDKVKAFLLDCFEKIKNAALIAFKAIVDFLTLVGNQIKEIWNIVGNFLSEKWQAIKTTAINIFTSIKDGIKNIWDGIVENIKSAVNSIISFINSMLGAINSIKISVPKVEYWPGKFFGGFEVGFPQIPTIPLLAKGGIVRSPTLAMIGEAGPEAVIPLRGGFAGAGGGINIYLQGDFYTDEEVATKWADKLAKLIMYQIRL
jgi:hypothetical protein